MEKGFGFARTLNNLNLAKTNAIIANRNGVKWIDSTVTGMGRGPGNLKTEDILQFLKVKNLRLILHKLINKHFLKLKNTSGVLTNIMLSMYEIKFTQPIFKNYCLTHDIKKRIILI